MILRHAKSSWSDLSLDDFDRPLKGRGKRDARKMGAFMARRGLVPDKVLCSPAKRASQTIRRACKELGMSTDLIEWRANFYLGSIGDFEREIAGLGADVERVLVVGHNPGLENLVRFLCDDTVPEPEDGKLVPTATLVRLDMREAWSGLGRGGARLVEIVRPKSLALKADIFNGD